MAGPYKSLEELDAALASKEPAQPYKSIGDLDAAITQSDANDETRLGFSAKQSLTSKPDQYIKARDLGGQFGIPPDVAERNLPEVEYRNKLDALIGTMRSSPALGTLMQDPGYLKRTHDDIDALAQIEFQTKGFRAASEFQRKALDAEIQDLFDKAWTGAKIEADIERNRQRTVLDYVGQGGSALASSLWSANSGLWGIGRAAADVVGTVLPDEAAKELTGFFTRYQQATGKTAQQMLGDPSQQGFVERSVYSGLQSLGQNLLTLPAALIPGVGAGVALGPMTAMTGGTEYGKARDKGVAIPQALIYGASQMAIEYATEVMPVTKFLGDIKAGTPFGQLLMKQVAYEIPGEQVATLLQDLNEWAVINPGKPFKSYLEERPSAAAQTLIATIVGVGGQATTVKGVETLVGAVTGQDQPFSDPLVRRAQAAQRTIESESTITQLVDTAGQSLSISRDPSAVQELIDQADEDGQSEVFINARQFANVFNQSPVETAAALGVTPEALNDALASNTDIVVPLSTFATAVARDQALRPIIEHTRVDPGDMSPSEARLWQSQQGDQFKAEAEAVLAKRQADETFKAEVQQVHDNLLGQLNQAGRWAPQVNQKYAAMVRDFYVTMADRAGMTVGEMAAKYPLRVVAEGQGALQQGPAQQPDRKFKIADLPRDMREELFNEHATNLNPEATEKKFYTRQVPSGLIDIKDLQVDEIPADQLQRYVSAKLADLPPIVIADGRLIDGQHRIQAARARGIRQLRYIDMTGLIDTNAGGFVSELPKPAVPPAPTLQQSPLENTPGFEQWSHGHPVIRIGDSHEFKAGEGVVVEALHGTTGDFTAFNRAMANIESDLGGGFYFTNNPADVGENYAGLGPDLTQKVELEYERQQQFLEDDEWSEGKTDEEIEAEARRRARQQFMANEGFTMPVFIRFDNPVVLGGSQETFLDIEESYNEETDEYGEPTGKLVDFVEALRDVGQDDRYSDADVEQSIADLWERNADNGGLTARELIEILSASEGLQYASDYENERSALASKEIIRKAFEAAGFDGFIDQTVNKKFGSERRIGKPMAGMGENTVHFIAFKPEQIKSRLGNSGVFSETDPDILKQGEGSPRASFDPSTNTIALLEGADWSSFLHESGHFFLEVMADLSSRPDAPAAIRKDFETALAWMGVPFDPIGGRSGAAGDMGGTLEQPAYHGSPYKFDKFSLEHLGKGEGAQAYGWGLYFAGKKGVAEHYRKALTGASVLSKRHLTPEEVTLTNTGDVPASTVKKMRSQLAAFASQVDFADQADVLRFLRVWFPRAVDKLPNDFRAESPVMQSGQLYEVDIPEEGSYLLWDKPLSEQPEAVKAALGANTTKGEVNPDGLDMGGGAVILDNRNGQADPNQVQPWVLKSGNSMFGLSQKDVDRMVGEQANATGENIYTRLTAEKGSAEAASKYLNSLGIAGIKYLDGTSRDKGEGSFNYVIFDDSSVKVLQTYYQGGPETEPGAPTTPLGRTAAETWAMMSLDEKRPYHEKWARGYEAYLFEGVAPSVEMQGIFQRFSQWMKQVYTSLKALNVELTDDVRGVFDRMLASEDAIKTAEAVRNFAPIFQTAEQAGMTAEEWAQYQAEGRESTDTAVDELQARSIRDMRWQANAKAKKIKELQATAKELRAEVKIDVRREVLSQPLYRAWQFLTGKNPDQIAKVKEGKNDPNKVDPTKDTLLTAIAKLGGIDLDQAVSEWGLDPADANAKADNAVGGKRKVVRKEGGRKLDAMAEALAQYGYLEVDATGKWDNRQFEEMFFDALRGGEYFSQYGEEAMIAAATREAQGDPDAGITLENTPAGKLNTEMLKGMYGETDTAPWRLLSALRMTSPDGLAPDQVADLFGFTSGDDLVRRLAVAEDPKALIDQLTDQRMLELHGDLATPAEIELAAERAIHNDVRASVLTRELNALRKATGQGNVMLKAARMHADQWLARQTVKNATRHAQHVAAEGRSARAVTESMKAGDLAAAAQHKLDQVLNNQLARGSIRAAEEVRKAVKYLKKFDKAGSRKAIDQDYLDQIDQLLERFDLRQVSGKALEKRASLAAWLKQQEELGLDPVIDAALVEEAQRQHYSTLTLEEFRGLVDSIQSIEHMGRLKNRLLTAKDKREFKAVKDELVANIIANANRSVTTTNAITPLEKGAKILRNFSAMHRKFASIVREMDGGKDGGPMWEYLVRTMNEAGDREVTLRGEMSEKFADLFDGIKGIKLNEKVFVPDLRISLRREELLAIALNSGNDGNVQRLLDGGINESLQAITGRQLMGVLNQITDKEWDFVEGVWRMIEENRPAIAAQEKALTGVEPKWVNPTPFTLSSGRVIRGGYFPAKYNADMSTRSNELEAVTDLRQQMMGAGGRAATRKSYTEQRSKEVTGRPLRLDLGVISQHINEVTHRLAWQAWLIDARRILNATEIDRAIRDHYGPEIMAQMKKQLADIAAGDNGPTDALDKVMNHIRNGTTIAGMGWNIMTSLMQPIGLTQSVERVGATWIAKGLGQYLASNPFKVTADVHERSEFMANRAKTINREINDVLNRIRADKMSRVEASYFYLIQKFQQMVDVPTWLGAYEKAIADGNADDRAVALADQAVIDSQGGGQLKDLSAIQRGGSGQKLFTNFYSFFNTTYNRAVENARATDFSNPMQVGKLAANYLLLFTLPAVWGWALKEALRGDDDDEDAKKIAKRLAMEQLNYLLGTMVLVREIGSAISGFSGYQGPAGTRFFAELGKLIKQTEQGDVDMALVKAAANTVGIAAHLPTGQIMKSVEGTVAVMDGKAGPQAVLVGPPIKN